MKILFIENKYTFHYEIIESVIVKYNSIIKYDNPCQIYLKLSYHFANKSEESKSFKFKEYIEKKYNNIIFESPNKYDYYISITVYNRNYPIIEKNSNNKFYISHEFNRQLKKLDNVYYLTPLAKKNLFKANILPFNNPVKKIKTDIPIYVIQGNLGNKRDFSLLEEIFKHKYDYDFIFKIIGGVDKKYSFPSTLLNKPNILIKTDLDFINYHKEFLDCYCLLPLTNKKKCPKYYQNKLTSSINYAEGYNLKCLIDKDLQNIYNLENVEIFNSKEDIVESFKLTLKEFYK